MLQQDSESRLSLKLEDTSITRMEKFILASLILNAAILVPVCLALLLHSSLPTSLADWVVEGYGQDSPARGILLSVYLAILVVTIALLFKPEPMLVAILLLFQVLYKLTTPFTVGSFLNPVVITNMFVAFAHATSLIMISNGLKYETGNRRNLKAGF